MKNFLINLTFESELSYLPVLRQVVRVISSAKITDQQQLEDIELSIHEALANVICHAYNSESNHQIGLSLTLSDEEIIIQIHDSGHASAIPYAPKNNAYDETSIENLPENGFGVFLITQLMDEVSYKSEKGENVLLLRKNIH